MHRHRTLLKGAVALGLLAALLAVVTFVTYEPKAQAEAASKGEFQLELIVSMPAGTEIGNIVSKIESSGKGSYSIDSFFDVTYVSNIGSSGQDGVRASSFIVDSFFDITYEIDFDTLSRSKFPTEMVAMTLTGTLSDPSKPWVVIDEIRKALEESSDGEDREGEAPDRVFYGHVTVLK